jgi:hypothetical protein
MQTSLCTLCIRVCVCVSKAVGDVTRRDVAGNFAPDVTAYYNAMSHAQR